MDIHHDILSHYEKKKFDKNILSTDNHLSKLYFKHIIENRSNMENHKTIINKHLVKNIWNETN